MEFGWINIFGAIIVVLILFPNIIYAVKKNRQDNTKTEVPQYLSVCEQIGRYGCVVLMWLPFLVWKFGFRNTEELLIYLLANGILLLSYYLFWIFYSRKKNLPKAMALAIIPTVIFLLSGILLRHWSLVAAAAIFGFAHCKITYMTHKEY